MAGVNPVYDAPSLGQRSPSALAKVPFVVSLNDRLDETSLLADVLAPGSHPFECWGDAALPKGVVAIQQPVIQPLFDTRGLLDVLVEWGAAVGDPAAIAAVAAAAAAATAAPLRPPRRPRRARALACHYLRAAWARRLGADPATPAFEAAWNDVLRSGPPRHGVRCRRPAVRKPATAAARLAARSTPAARAIAPAALALLGALAASGGADLELQLYPHLALGDGRAGNNGWLHELPDPITRITWGGALSIAPRRFDEMKLANGDLVEVDAGHAKLVAPAYRHAGMHHDQVALPLGLGRAACGVIGDGVGPNAFPLRLLANGRLLSAGLPVTIRKVGGNEELAFAQGSDVIDRARRPLVPATTLTAFEKDRTSGTEQQEGGPSAWPGIRVPEGALGDGDRPQQVQRVRQVRHRLPGREQHPGRRPARDARTAARCRGCGSTATTTRRRRTAGGTPTSGTARSTWSRSRGRSSSRCSASTARTRRAKPSARSWRRCTARTG